MQRVELIKTAAAFHGLAEPWQHLWQERHARVFQSHPWLAAWVSHMMKSNYRVHIGVLWQHDGRMSAVLPFAVRRFRGARVLEWAGQAVCDYCDGIGEPSDLQIIWTALRRAGGFDIVRLKNLPRDAAALASLPTGFGRGILAEADSCLCVERQWASGDAWFKTLNKKKRNNFTRGLRILEETGPTAFTCLTEVDETVVARLYELKQAWLEGTGQTSDLITDDAPDRLLMFTRALAQLGRLCLFVIRCQEQVVAASINIVDGTDVQAFFAAYDAQFDRASPGILLMTAYTIWAFNNGFNRIDYLRGEELYKFEFANGNTDLLSYIGSGHVFGQIALTALQLRSKISHLRDRSNPTVETGGAYRTKAGTMRKFGD